MMNHSFLPVLWIKLPSESNYFAGVNSDDSTRIFFFKRVRLSMCINEIYYAPCHLASSNICFLQGLGICMHNSSPYKMYCIDRWQN